MGDGVRTADPAAMLALRRKVELELLEPVNTLLQRRIWDLEGTNAYRPLAPGPAARMRFPCPGCGAPRFGACDYCGAP